MTANRIGVTFGQSVTLSGVVTSGGLPLQTNQIQLAEVDPAGKETSLGTLSSAADGSFSVTVKPLFNGTFFVHYGAVSASIPSLVGVAAHRITASVKGHAVTVRAQFLPGVAFKGTLKVPLSQIVTDKFGHTKTVKTTLVIGPRVKAPGLPFGYGTATLKLTLPAGQYTISLQVPATAANAAGPVQKIFLRVI